MRGSTRLGGLLCHSRPGTSTSTFLPCLDDLASAEGSGFACRKRSSTILQIGTIGSQQVAQAPVLGPATGSSASSPGVASSATQVQCSKTGGSNGIEFRGPRLS